MSDLFLLSRTQVRLIEPLFPRLRGLPRTDYRASSAAATGRGFCPMATAGCFTEARCDGRG